MKYPVILLYLSLRIFGNESFSADMTIKDNKHLIVYDGLTQKRFDMENNGITLSKVIPTTAQGKKVLLVAYKHGYRPYYVLIEDKKHNETVKIQNLEKFSEKKENYAYLSGAVSRASVGGKRNFHTGITRMEEGKKIHISKLSSKGGVEKDFYITTDKNGQFGMYVLPGLYTVIHGTKKEFHLKSGENGIFLVSIKSMFD